MAKDYAKSKAKKNKSGASRGKKKSPVSIKLIITALIIMGAMIAFLVYLKVGSTSSTIESTKKSIVNKAKINEPKKTPYISNKNNSEPKIEPTSEEVPFYKTHEEMVNKTVEIPIEDLKLPEDSNKYVYIMPCGSFREKQRAEELRAKIAFAGYESKIKKITAKSGLWYRVELGPFKRKRKAESIRHRLQDNGLNYCKIYPKKIS